MQITLTQAEIEVGIKMYIASRGVEVEGRDISSDFTATRKNNIGISVEVDLGEDTSFLPNRMDAPLPEGSNVSVMPNRSGGVSARRTSKSTGDTGATSQPEPTPEPEPEPKEEKTEEVEQPDPKPSTAAPGEKASTAGEKETPTEPEPEPEQTKAVEETKEEAPAEETKAGATSLFGNEAAKESKPATDNPFADTPNDTTEEAPKKRNSIFGS